METRGPECGFFILTGRGNGPIAECHDERYSVCAEQIEHEFI